MIRRMTAADAGAVADIWLAANLDAHGFIPADYWRGCHSAVREAIAGAEVYVYEGPEGIEGFIGLEGEHIAGLFVRAGSRGRGIGRAMLGRRRPGGMSSASRFTRRTRGPGASTSARASAPRGAALTGTPARRSWP